jgi:uncharacterized protein YbcI
VSSTEDRPARAERGDRALEISNMVVKLASEVTGRGPTKARTYLNDDLVTVVLRDTLTRGERSLVEDGKRDLVMRLRFEFQQTMRADLVAGIEGIVERKVVAFMSANHMEPDLAVETFVLDGQVAATHPGSND